MSQIKQNKKKKAVRRNRFSPIKASQTYIDYKDIDLLKKFINSHGKIMPAKLTGIPVKKQRMVASAIKRARFMALLPFSQERIKK